MKLEEVGVYAVLFQADRQIVNGPIEAGNAVRLISAPPSQIKALCDVCLGQLFPTNAGWTNPRAIWEGKPLVEVFADCKKWVDPVKEAERV